MLTFHLFGPFSAALDGKPLGGLSRRGQGLLAYLASLPGMRAERGKLADLLWGDRSEDQARASLRQELSVLRKALPEGALTSDRQAVWLDPTRVSVPVGTGQFMDGFDLSSEPFEDWLRERRANPPDAAPVSSHTPAPLKGRPSIAVMAFDGLGADEGDMLADGIVEEIIAALSRVREFHVIARQSSIALTGLGLSVPEAAEKLGVDYVVEGTVRRAGERVRITTQLVRGKDGRVLWADRFDDRIADLFDLQDKIASMVAGKVSPSLRLAEIERVAVTRNSDRSAYELYMAAHPHFWAHSREENLKALNLLDQSLAVDAGFAPALALKAWATGQQTSYMWSTDPEDDMAAAMDLVEQAAPAAGNHSPTLTAISAAIMFCTDDIDRANWFIDQANAADENNAWAWMRKGWSGGFAGNIAPALEAFDRAEALSPLDPFRFNMAFGRASAYYNWTDNFDKALALIDEGLRLNPGAQWAHRMRCNANFAAGNFDASKEAAQKLIQAYPGITVDLLRRSLPRSARMLNAHYFEALAKGGIPET